MNESGWQFSGILADDPGEPAKLQPSEWKPVGPWFKVSLLTLAIRMADRFRPLQQCLPESHCHSGVSPVFQGQCRDPFLNDRRVADMNLAAMPLFRLNLPAGSHR
jgi:hypothetical protein